MRSFALLGFVAGLGLIGGSVSVIRDLRHVSAEQSALTGSAAPEGEARAKAGGEAPAPRRVEIAAPAALTRPGSSCTDSVTDSTAMSHLLGMTFSDSR